jgi:hypothetical protein
MVGGDAGFTDHTTAKPVCRRRKAPKRRGQRRLSRRVPRSHRDQNRSRTPDPGTVGREMSERRESGAIDATVSTASQPTM